MSFTWIFAGILLLFSSSQFYWYLRARALVRRLVSGRAARLGIAAAGLGVYFLVAGLNFGLVPQKTSPTHLTLYTILVSAPFALWVLGSVGGFLVAVVFWLVERAARVFAKPAREVASPGRREFLQRTASVATAAPFLAGAYGLFYGRLNLEISRQPIRLARLPKAFQGFRIAQLSDIHIGPYMSEAQVRKYVEITNELKPDLIALTGDFVTWDPSTQLVVVRALAGLHAPFGIFGCLGNHEAWSRTEDSITELFRQAGIPILRQARATVAHAGESLNLIGVDYKTQFHSPGPPNDHFVKEYLEGVDALVAHDTVNILLSHNPNTFDRAAELGIDLSLAGHTHGGQVALEFISPEIAPSRLITPYVAGWFGKAGGQLYVNRGIGTIGIPMRMGAPPEITVYELVREA